MNMRNILNNKMCITFINKSPILSRYKPCVKALKHMSYFYMFLRHTYTAIFEIPFLINLRTNRAGFSFIFA